MLKKFVSLNADKSPSKNPYEVRTYMGDRLIATEWKAELCTHQRNCDKPGNSTIAKVLTIEEEIRRLHAKTKVSRFRKPFEKRKCKLFDDYTECVVPQRTPKELKENAIYREKFLTATDGLRARVHDVGPSDLSTSPSLVKLKSPIFVADEGEEGRDYDEDETMMGEDLGEEEDAEAKKRKVKPRQASPSCSLDVIYVPTPKLLQLKRPKSGMYINPTVAPEVEPSRINYSIYNPRALQEQFDYQGLKRIDILDGESETDKWTWNMGLQRREDDLDNEFLDAVRPRFDCNDMEIQMYEIPKDLHKTFIVQIVFGSDSLLPEEPKAKPSFYYRPKEIACIYVAFVDSYRKSPDFWEAPEMDAVMAGGNKLYNKSNNLNYKSDAVEFDILPQLIDRHAIIGIKIHYTGSLSDEPNIFKALTLYFSKYNAVVLVSNKLFLLIWKRCRNTYFIYDPNGRDERGKRDFENGRSTLSVINHIEHVVHCIVNFSEIDCNADYHLYEIYLINYGKITKPIISKAFPKLSKRIWAVVNNTYAIIPAANNGLQQPKTGNASNASMIIALVALLYSHIETASDWGLLVIDDLVKFGQTYYKAFAKKLKLKKKQHLNIMDIPEKIMMGVFHASIKKYPFLFTGHVVDCSYYSESQLTAALKELFAGKWEAALLEIDNCVLAVWRDSNYYYVFDSFRRGKAGQVLDEDDFLTKGVACLQMHTTFESLCRILLKKAIPMRRGTKFFMHGISIGCIRPKLTPFKNKYKQLQLSYPPIKSEIDKLPKVKSVDKERKKKGKKGKKGLERKFSIQVVPEAERIPEFDSIDVVGGVLEEVLCEILTNLPEKFNLKRKRLYKQAEKVLLKSDKCYLEKLKYDLKHGEDIDNVHEAYRTEPLEQKQVITLEDELLIPSNFEALPDGVWVIFSSFKMPKLEDETAKLGGLLAALITAGLTSKYKISTWNTVLVDYALEETNGFGPEFTDYEQVLELVVMKRIPKLKIGSNTYSYTVQKLLKSSEERSLRQVLLESLINYNRLLIICQRFSCLIIKRYNFLYMFVGFACNGVGIRKFGTGNACMLRFIELDSLIRRIEFGCNPQGNPITNYVVVALKVTDITNKPPKVFRKMLDVEQEQLFRAEFKEEEEQKRRRIDKVRFLDQELRKENERINKFLTLKQRKLLERQLARELKLQKNIQKKKAKDKKAQKVYLAGEEEGEEEGVAEGEGEEMLEEAEGEEEGEVELKHLPGKKLPRMLQYKFKPRPILYGYGLREKDCLFKIQGSKALKNRAEASLEEIKTCFFASTLAILYAILRPLHQWHSQRVDRVIENALTIASKVTNMTTAFERVIKNITVDDYEFDVWAKLYDILGIGGDTMDRKIAKATSTRQYILIQTPNATFAIYRDDYYHLFDPYKSLEKLQEEEEEEEEDELDEVEEDEEGTETKKKKPKCGKGIRRYRDRDAASWVLFADTKSMVKYMDARISDTKWKEDELFTMHIIDIISYKKASPESRTVQLLTDLAVPMYTGPAAAEDDEAHICAHAETINWLDLENCLPAWSRLNRRNSAGRYRNMPLTKLKKYDVEIDGRLWSVWGTLHPQAVVFSAESRGKQHLACYIIACCAASVYNLTDWSSQLLDNIVISGDKYHRDSLAGIKRKDYEFSLEDLNIQCNLENLTFVVHIEHVAYGRLYNPHTNDKMNLADALMYFFTQYQFGVIQCNKRALAIGHTPGFDGGYFMFDCQTREHPLFPKGQGASYLLRTKYLQVLLYCIVVTLNIPYYNMQFTIHKVQMFRKGEELDEEEGAEEDDEL